MAAALPNTPDHASKRKSREKSTAPPLIADIIPPSRRPSKLSPTKIEPLLESAKKSHPTPLLKLHRIPGVSRTEARAIEETLDQFFSKKTDGEKKPASEEKADASKKLEVRAWRPQRSRWMKLWLLGGGILGAGLAAVILLSTVFARANFSIEPSVEVRTLAPTPVRVTPDARAIDVVQGVIPGELIEFTDSKSANVRATGKSFVSERARGVVTIFNGYGTDPQVLVAGTRLMTDDGKLFRLLRGVTVPGAIVKNGEIVPSSLDATVIAGGSGEEYNIQPAVFHIVGFKGTTKYQKFSVKSTAAFSGGFNGEATVITAADLKQASEQATADAYMFMRDSLANKIPSGFVVIDGAREIMITNVSTPSAGKRTDQFSVLVTARARALSFRAADEGSLIAALFSTSTPRIFLNEGSAIERRSIALDLNKRQLSYVLAGSARLGGRLDTKALGDELAGKSEDEARDFLLSQRGVQGYRLKLFPFWLSKVPNDPAKVDVSVLPFGS